MVFYRNCVHFYTFIYNVIISIMIVVFCRLSYGVIRMGVLSLHEICIVSRACCIEIIQFARFVVARLFTFANHQIRHGSEVESLAQDYAPSSED